MPRGGRRLRLGRRLDGAAQPVGAGAIAEHLEPGEVLLGEAHRPAQDDEEHDPEPGGQAGDGEPHQGDAEPGHGGAGAGEEQADGRGEQDRELPPARAHHGERQDGHGRVVEAGHVLVREEACEEAAVGGRHHAGVEERHVGRHRGEQSGEDGTQVEAAAGDAPDEADQRGDAHPAAQPLHVGDPLVHGDDGQEHHHRARQHGAEPQGGGVPPGAPTQGEEQQEQHGGLVEWDAEGSQPDAEGLHGQERAEDQLGDAQRLPGQAGRVVPRPGGGAAGGLTLLRSPRLEEGAVARVGVHRSACLVPHGHARSSAPRRRLWAAPDQPRRAPRNGLSRLLE